MNQGTHKAIIILFIMKLYIEFLLLSFSADDEESPVEDGLTAVMKWVVIHGCFLCLGVLYCQRRGHPSLALHHLQMFHYFSPAIFASLKSAAAERHSDR